MALDDELLKIFVDADVLIAGAATPSTASASLVILRLGSLTLIKCLISVQVRIEAVRNIQKKVPEAETRLLALIEEAVEIVNDPTLQMLDKYEGQADRKDTPLLAAAVENGCNYLVTFNTRHYYPAPGQITVLKPGELVVQIRSKLSELG